MATTPDPHVGVPEPSPPESAPVFVMTQADYDVIDPGEPGAVYVIQG